MKYTFARYLKTVTSKGSGSSTLIESMPHNSVIMGSTHGAEQASSHTVHTYQLLESDLRTV